MSKRVLLSRAAPFLAAVAAGLILAFCTIGPRVLNPFNTSWITGDPATNQTGFAFMRHESLFVFPLTWSHSLAYPMGFSTAWLDNIPLAAVFFKLFDSVLPENFQYLGLFFFLCAGLQFHFGRRLTENITHDKIFSYLGGLFFLFSPPMTWRAGSHFALCAHFLILAALCELIPATWPPTSYHRYIKLLIICAIAGAIHPYLTLMVLGTSAAALARPWFAQPTPRQRTHLIALGAACVFAALVSMTLFGFLSPGHAITAAGGYGFYTMDPLAPIDPQNYASLALRQRVIAPDQFEGYNYLGLGLILIAIVGFTRRFATGFRLPAHFPTRIVFTLIAVSAVCAMSTRITMGGHVIANLALPSKVIEILSAVRSTGRFFWPGYYALTALILASARSHQKPATLLLAAALLVQIYDTAQLRASIHTQWQHSTQKFTLTNPIWEKIGPNESHLSLIPALACGWGLAPGGQTAEPTFSRFANDHHQSLDSFRAARISIAWQSFICAAPARLRQTGLSPDTAYIFRPDAIPLLVDLARRQKLAGKYCGLADNVILCSTAWAQSGIDPDLLNRFLPPVRAGEFSLQNQSTTPILLGNFVSPTNGPAQTQTHQSTIIFRLGGPLPIHLHVQIAAASILPAPASNQQVIIEAAGTELWRGLITSAQHNIEFDAPIAAVTPDHIIELTLTLPNATPPSALSLNADDRVLSIALDDMILKIQ